MRNIGLIGKARSGKDTVAARLRGQHGYQRVAFADPLKEAALRVDPLVAWPGRMDVYRLSYLVRHHGWEYVKDEVPEVRRILQQMGQAVREADADFWVRVALAKIDALCGLPVVVTDVRYPNEAEALRAAGFMLVRIERRLDRHPFRTASQHESETALDDFIADAAVFNDGSIAELHRQVDVLPLLV